MKTSYSDYRAVDGIEYPFQTETKIGNILLQQQIVEIKHNLDLPDDLFSAPAQPPTGNGNGSKESDGK